MFKSVIRGMAVAAALSLAGSAFATPVFSTAAVVTTATNVATFNSLNANNIDLTNYQEGGIKASVADYTYQGFGAFSPADTRTTGFHYGSGGNNSWVTISLANGGLITSLDFLLGDGNYGSTTNLIWETFSGVTSTGFGDIVVNKGTVGWTDNAGFTSIRVAAYGYGVNNFGDTQAIALDDLRIGTTNVPEPVTLGLLGFGLLGMSLARRKA